MLFDKLESFDESQGFIHGATDWQVINGDLTHGTRRVNQEQASVTTAFTCRQFFRLEYTYL